MRASIRRSWSWLAREAIYDVVALQLLDLAESLLGLVEPVVHDALGRIETTVQVAQGANGPVGRGHGQGRDDSVANSSHSISFRPPPAGAGTRCRCRPRGSAFRRLAGFASRSRCTDHVRWMPGALLGAGPGESRDSACPAPVPTCDRRYPCCPAGGKRPGSRPPGPWGPWCANGALAGRMKYFVPGGEPSRGTVGMTSGMLPQLE